MKPTDAVQALSKLKEGFDSFNRQVAQRSRTIAVAKERIRVEGKGVKLSRMIAEHLEKKMNAIQGLTTVLGSETAKVEELQKRVIEQRQMLAKTCEITSRMEMAHTETMAHRMVMIEKFEKSYDSRLEAAVKEKWKAKEQLIQCLVNEEKSLREQLKRLKDESRQKELDYRRERDKYEMDMLQRERDLEVQAKIKIESLQKKKWPTSESTIKFCKT